MKIATYKVYASKYVSAEYLKAGELFTIGPYDKEIMKVDKIIEAFGLDGTFRIRSIHYFKIDSPELGIGALGPKVLVYPIKAMLYQTD